MVVIGGGDTGMDCIASAHREGARVLMLDTYGAVPDGGRYPDTPWPERPRRTLTTYALDEGGERRFGTSVPGIEGEDGAWRACAAAAWREVARLAVPGRSSCRPTCAWWRSASRTRPTTACSPARRRARRAGQREGAGVRDLRPGVFAAGDARVGQSLIVSAIAEGAARRGRWTTSSPTAIGSAGTPALVGAEPG